MFEARAVGWLRMAHGLTNLTGAIQHAADAVGHGEDEQADAELRQGLSDLRAIGERIRAQARYYEAPAGLRERVLRQVRRAEPRAPV